MTVEEWMSAWTDIQAVMDSENGEELTPWVHAQAVLLARAMPPQKELMAWRMNMQVAYKAYADIRVILQLYKWRLQTGRSNASLKEHRHLNRKLLPYK